MGSSRTAWRPPCQSRPPAGRRRRAASRSAACTPARPRRVRWQQPACRHARGYAELGTQTSRWRQYAGATHSLATRTKRPATRPLLTSDAGRCSTACPGAHLSTVGHLPHEPRGGKWRLEHIPVPAARTAHCPLLQRPCMSVTPESDPQLLCTSRSLLLRPAHRTASFRKAEQLICSVHTQASATHGPGTPVVEALVPHVAAQAAPV